MSNIKDLLHPTGSIPWVPMEYQGITNLLLSALNVIADELDRVAKNLDNIEKQLSVL